MLREEPDLARQVSADGITPLWWLPDDEARAIAIAEMLLAAGADPSIRSRDGHTAADWAWRRGMTAVAQRLAVGGQSPSWPAMPPPASPDYAKLDALAHDLFYAFESGNAESPARLTEYAGREATWDQLRRLAREQLNVLGREERPVGYFSIDHARLLVARREGFKDWAALEASFRASN